MPDTKPDLQLDHEGVCNACRSYEQRQHVDWAARHDELLRLLEKYRRRDGSNWDCIVPVSGGKDSSYVAYMMKHELGMHPLCVNIIPPLEFEVGRKNVENFINSGYDCVRIAPNPLVTKRISRRTLIDYGQPLMSWISVSRFSVRRRAPSWKLE